MRFYSFLLTLALLSGCRKQVLDPSRPFKDYEHTSLLPGNKIINSTFENNRLYIMHDHTVSIIEMDGSQTDLNFEGSNQLMLSIRSDFFVTTEAEPNGALVFFPTKNPAKANTKQFTSANLGIPEGRYFFSYCNCSAINSEAQFLAFIHLDDDLSESALFFFEVKMLPNGLIDKVEAKRLTLPYKISAKWINVVASSFVVSTWNGPTLLIKRDGSVQKVLDQEIENVVSIGTNHYATSNGAILLSEDEGETWININNRLSMSKFSDRFFVSNTIINKQHILFGFQGIAQVQFHPDGRIDIGELDRVGLGEGILNIFEWKDKVFVVTRTGIFTRSLSDFFTPAL